MVATTVEARWRQQAVTQGLKAIERLAEQGKIPKKYAEPVKTRNTVREVHQVRQMADALTKLADLPAIDWGGSSSTRPSPIQEHLELTGNAAQDYRTIRDAHERQNAEGNQTLRGVELPPIPEVPEEDLAEIQELDQGQTEGMDINDAQVVDPATGLLAPAPIVRDREDDDSGGRYGDDLLPADEVDPDVETGQGEEDGEPKTGQEATDQEEVSEVVEPMAVDPSVTGAEQPKEVAQATPEGKKPAEKRTRPRASYVAGQTQA